MKTLLPVGLLTLSLLNACTTQPDGEGSMPDFAQLSGEPWQVQTLNQKPVGNATVTLSFPEPGKIAGLAACNNYLANYTSEGERFTIQPGAMTRKACMPPLMELEQRFVEALKGVDTAVLNELGELVLSGEGAELKATR